MNESQAKKGMFSPSRERICRCTVFPQKTSSSKSFLDES